MGLFSRKQSGFPTTPFGYQPPPDADVRSWACSDPTCEGGEYAPDPRSWPKSCPQCGAPVATGSIRGTYEHDAERAELDYRLRSPKDDFELSRAKRHDIVWRYKDAARRGDVATARQVRAELEASAAGQPSYGLTYMERSPLLDAALANGLIEEAADHLKHWYSVAPIGKPAHTGEVADVRILAAHTIDFLDNPAGAASPSASELWDSLKILMSLSNDISTADMNVGFARLRQRLG
jgi:hypothetical protein